MARGARTEIALFALALVAALHGFGLPSLGPREWRPSPRPADALRIVTWNVGQAGEADERAGQEEIEQRVIEVLEALDADLVVLQEVGGASRLAAFARPFVGAVTAQTGDGAVAVIARRGELVPLRVGAWDGPRPPLDVLYRARDGARVHLVVLHASPWSAARRNEAIGRSVELLEARLAPLRVLAGDLNLDVTPGGGTDLFSDDEYADVRTYNYVAERLTDAGRDAGPTAEPDRRLDYLFFSSEGAELLDAGVWRGRRVGAMDHHPLVVDLRPGR